MLMARPNTEIPSASLKESFYGHLASGPIWDKMMHKCMKQNGFLRFDGPPGFFYNPTLDADIIVYVDDFILIATPSKAAGVWKLSEKLIEFKDFAITPRHCIAAPFGC